MTTKTAAEALEEIYHCVLNGSESALGRAIELLDKLRAHPPATEEGRGANSTPEKIYLQTGDGEDFTEDHPLEFDSEQVTWCSEQQYDSDIPYIRADLAQQPAQGGGRESPTERINSRYEKKYGDLSNVMRRIQFWQNALHSFRDSFNQHSSEPVLSEDVDRAEREMLSEIRNWQARAALTPQIGEAVAWMNAEGIATSQKNKVGWQLDSFNVPLYLHPAQPAEQEGDKARLEAVKSGLYGVLGQQHVLKHTLGSIRRWRTNPNFNPDPEIERAEKAITEWHRRLVVAVHGHPKDTALEDSLKMFAEELINATPKG